MLRPLSRAQPGGSCRPRLTRGHHLLTKALRAAAGGRRAQRLRKPPLPGKQPCEGAVPLSCLWPGSLKAQCNLWGRCAVPAATAEPAVLSLQPKQGCQLQGAGSSSEVCCIQREIMNERLFSPHSPPILGALAEGRAAGTAYTRPFNQSWDKQGLIWAG